MRVLLVEDSERLAAGLARGLGHAGLVVDAVSDGCHADQILADEDYDAVVLDLALPRLSGLDVLRRARARGNAVPVLILTASGSTAERVRGLNAGADDYLPKPCDLDELVARVRAIGRRRAGVAASRLTLGALEFDLASRVVHVNGRELELPPRERALLELLLLAAGRPLGKRQLGERLCRLDESITPDAIEIYVHRLRRRLAGSGVEIHTLRGLGYRLGTADAPP